MPQTIITQEDLDDFRFKLLEDFKELLQNAVGKSESKQRWMKNKEVESFLGISPGKLHLLRVSGVLPHTKIGRIIYYDYEDVIKMMKGGKR